MPETVESRMSSYYCARIESGYVRNGYVNLYFIDKEQRRWLYTGAISETIEGSIHRVSQSDGSKISSRDYLMPQDAAYYQHSSNSTKQMVLAKRDKEPTNPLSCIYYYKGVDIDFLIPESVWNHCNDPALCHNLRLAIIGMKPIPNWLDSKDTKPIVAEFLSATLSDVDRVGTARTIYMRDTPHVKFRNSSGMFWATAIVYDDANGNGITTKSSMQGCKIVYCYSSTNRRQRHILHNAPIQIAMLCTIYIDLRKHNWVGKSSVKKIRSSIIVHFERSHRSTKSVRSPRYRLGTTTKDASLSHRTTIIQPSVAVCCLSIIPF